MIHQDPGLLWRRPVLKKTIYIVLCNTIKEVNSDLQGVR